MIGETPVVNVQSVQREIVLQGDFVSSLPATRNYSSILQSIPALNVGILISAETTPEMQLFTARGGEANEGRITIDGLTVAASASPAMTTSRSGWGPPTICSARARPR